MNVKPKITELLKRLNDGVLEKEEIIRLSLLSAIAGESIFLLGAPGVAKSLVARRLKFAFAKSKAFEYLMSRFSTPDEIFGPVSISKLKEDKYERIVNNYLPSSDVVFLDEIWKAGPSIQNSLLTVLNEKVYRNGDVEIKVPIKALISASNELPSKGEGLEALWDRFLIRLIVEGVESKENFEQMISKSLCSEKDTITEILKISKDDYNLWSKEVDKIEVPENVLNVIHVIRANVQLNNQKEENKEKQIYISDRRWRKIVRLLRTSAFLNDRKAVDLMDCFLIKNCIWNEADQIEIVSVMVSDSIEKHGYSMEIDLTDLKKNIDYLKKDIEDTTTTIIDNRKEEIIQTDGYVEVLNYPTTFCKISSSEITNLNNQERIIQMSNHNYQGTNNKIKKGNSVLHVSIDGLEYKLNTKIVGKKRIITKTPHDSHRKYVEDCVKELFRYTKEAKNLIGHYLKEDLKHIKTNLFVDKNLSSIVENRLLELNKEIAKYEIEIREIQFKYDNIKNDEKIEQ